MANVRTIKRRIRSVQNTAKITKAMEMIAASKMRRTQQRVLASRPYANRMREVLGNLAYQIQYEEVTHPLLEQRPIQRVSVVHITPDRGLCGGLNANLNRSAAQHIITQESPVSVITVGRKGRDFMTRSGQEVRAVFSDLGDRPNVVDVAPIAHAVVGDYLSHYVDVVYLVYAEFVNTTLQRPIIRQLLPVESTEVVGGAVGYIYEPYAPDLLDLLTPRYVEMQLYHALLESVASEQSARMVAMRNATDSAGEMVETLTLTMNKVRQEGITRELLDIVGGVAALEG